MCFFVCICLFCVFELQIFVLKLAFFFYLDRGNHKTEIAGMG